MQVKKGDKVKIMAGKDKGKEGQVNQVLIKENRVVVEGVNKIFKHLKPRQTGTKGQRLELWGPISVSNVQVICPKCSKNTRLSHKLLEDGKKVRLCKKCGQVI